MSQLVFPALPGLALACKRTPTWATLVQTGSSQKEQRAALNTSMPRYKYEWPLNFARQLGFGQGVTTDELVAIQTLFNSVRGQWDSFLFSDPASNAAAATSFGTAVSGTLAYQLLDLEGFPIYDLNGTPSVYVAGALTTPASVVNGLVTFSAQPAAGAALTWSGGYYRRCRFAMDDLEMERMGSSLWGGVTLKLISVNS